MGPDGFAGTLDNIARAYINAVRSHLKPKTVTRKITAIRSYGKHVGQDLLVGYRAPTPLRAVPHPLDGGTDDVMAMVAAAHDPRQVALVVLGGMVGLRVSESLAALPTDLDPHRMMLRVQGKGDREREVPVSQTAWRLLAPAVALAWPDKRLAPYSDRRARQIITDCARWAGISRPVASHDLRATFATEAYRRCLDLRAVQELLGHASSVTTEGYVKASERAMKAAVGN